jgi:Protein of unknown function (DUF1559)
MRTCPSCAERLPPGADECPSCGISIHEADARPAKRGSGMSLGAILLLVGAGAVVVMLCCGGIGTALLLPAVQQAREAARRTQCKNNLRQIGMALQNYHDTYKTFPPAFVADEQGKPMHSWRVLILPYLGRLDLYARYDFSEPWDGPNNSRLALEMPAVYACPSHPGAGGSFTAYAAVFGDACVFRGAEAVKQSDINDGLSNTLLVGEVSQAGLHWMAPVDIDVSQNPGVGNTNGFSSYHIGGGHFLMGDGAVRFISQDVSQGAFQALTTRAGGESPGEY